MGQSLKLIDMPGILDSKDANREPVEKPESLTHLEKLTAFL